MLRQIARLIFLFVIFAPIVNADPIVLSGSVTLVPGPLPSGVQTEPYVLTGMGFSANITGSTGGFGISPCSTVSAGPPTPCTTANLGWNSVGTDNFGSYTINGTTVPINVITQLSLFFSSETFVIPPELRDAPGVEVIAPFTFTGFAVTPDGNSVLDLTGGGTVRLLLIQQAVGNVSGLFLERAVYTFGPVASEVSVEAIPEPTTLLLLGSGLAGVLGLRKRRR